MIKRLLLLPIMMLLSLYLITVGLVFFGYLPEDINLEALSRTQTKLFKLKKTYHILHLKRIILEEQHAILLATIKINTLVKAHKEISWPTLMLATPTELDLKDNKSLSTSKKKVLASEHPHDQPETSKANTNTNTNTQEVTSNTMTKQEQQSYQDLKHFIHDHDNSTKKLSLNSEEKKTYNDLNHFIEEKKLSQQSHLSSDEKWLLATPGKLFTIQIFGAPDEVTAKTFVKKHNIKHTHLFHTYYLNKPWVAVVVGKYANYNEALKHLANYPHGDQPPWIRPISSIHSAIKLYR